MEDEELAGWLRLALVPGLGTRGARRLLAAFGLPQAIFSQSAAALSQVMPAALAQALLAPPEALAAQLDTALAWLAQGTDDAPRRILTLADTGYPACFLQMEDPPLMVYAVGDLEALAGPAVAIVGSRNPTAQGVGNATRFARELASAGQTVVSGLALGIDAAAHEGALAGAAPGQPATIAVVGTGADRVYPRQNLELAHRIVRRGLVLSEYPLGTPPIAANFPRRNRLIAALGQGTLVVEAALKSGSLITARCAAEQGKDVFAVPGSIHSPQSRGCHALLREGARLVESAAEVLQELRIPAVAVPLAAQPATPAPEPSRPQAQRQLLQALGYDPVHLDTLVARTGTGAAELQAHLLELELAGEVARLPGGLYQRVGSA